MPTYVFACPTCGTTTEELRCIAERNDPMRCPACGAAMGRDLAAEGPMVVSDPDACTADLHRYMQQREEGKEVDRPVLSQALGRVPGLRKFRHGRHQFAVFRNRQERSAKLKGMGLVDLDA